MESQASLLVNCMLLAFRKLRIHANVDNNNYTNFENITSTFNLTSFDYQSTNNVDNDSLEANALDSPSYNRNIYHDFIGECLKSPPVRPYEISVEQKALWTFLFGTMLFTAIIGNSIVIWIVLAHREMRTTTNYFLLNLSVADLLMSSLNCMFNFIYMLNSDWPFGSVYCSLNNFAGNVTVAVSVFTLVAISFNRYVAIVRPLHRRNSRKKARRLLYIIWILSTLLSAPCFIYSTTESKQYYNGKTRTVCYMLWPDGKYPISTLDYVYNIVFLAFTYGIPMVVMIICYYVMGRELWGSQSIGENTERQTESVKSKKKVVRMFIAVVTIFAICWLPYHMFYVYAYHQPHITSTNITPHLFLAFYWLAMSNSMVNPIIYYWMNRRFRHYFQRILCFCCFRLWKMDDTFLQRNSMSIERKPRLLKRRTTQSYKLSDGKFSTKTART
ncbi:tachykinin-like peptides receptor 86C [Sitodiplosis mosellana]|uniref:tachykinin-like peptides receptor 86C n=1 Tax=Sitodiplosis mosellana TaxID=263140 RepID=UPI002444181E|nr:tachykinin-like peptides receptor 86C [Sitodiplosis mosellana]